MMRPIGRFESEPSPTSRLGKGCPASMPGEQPHRRAGVAAIDFGFRRGEFSPFPVHNEHLGLGLFDFDPKRTHRDNGVHAIVAAGKAA